MSLPTKGAMPPVINIQVTSQYREDLTQEQAAELDRRLSNATISPEAMALLQDRKAQILELLANLELDPSRPALYSQWVYYHKAQIALLDDLSNSFFVR